MNILRSFQLLLHGHAAYDSTTGTSEESLYRGSVVGLLFEGETYELRGAVFEVYKDKGAGFLESVYQECLVLEFLEREVPFVAQPQIELDYRGHRLQTKFRPDFVCFDKIVMELKAVKTLTDDHRGQLHNYLKASELSVGLLVNFGSQPRVEIERIIRN